MIKSKFLLVPAALALSVSALPLSAAEAIMTYTIEDLYPNKGVYFSVSDEKKQLKEVKIEIWSADKSKFVAYGTQYRTFAGKPTDTLDIEELFMNNPNLEVNTSYNAKVITVRTDGTRDVDWAPFTVPTSLPSANHQVIFKNSGTGFTASVKDKLQDLKQVRVEYWSADGKTSYGPANNYLTNSTSKVAVIINDDFSKSKNLLKANGANRVTAKIITVRNDGTRSYSLIPVDIDPKYTTPATVTTSVSNNKATIKIADKLNNFKATSVDIYTEDKKTKLGTIYNKNVSAKNATVTVNDSFATNAVYKQFNENKNFYYKVLIVRHDGTLTTQWVKYTVPIKYVKTVGLTTTTTDRLVNFNIKNVGNGKILAATATIYADTDILLNGSKFFTKNAVISNTKTGVDAVTISGDVAKEATFNKAGTYKVKLDVKLSDNKTYSQVSTFTVTQAQVDVIKKATTEAKAKAQAEAKAKAEKIEVLNKERAGKINLGIISGKTNRAEITVSDPYKLASKVEITIHDANNKFLFNAAYYRTNFTKPNQTLTIYEKFYAKSYKVNTNYRMTVKLTRTDGTVSTLNKPFKTGSLLVK